MKETDADVLRYQTCRTFDGRSERVGIAKRNGHPMPLFDHSWTHPAKPEDSSDLAELIKELCYNLNVIERRTWLMLLDGRPVVEIAIEERVTRTAIYERIRGSSKGHGGMIAKNDYVALWWCQRLRSNLP